MRSLQHENPPHHSTYSDDLTKSLESFDSLAHNKMFFFLSFFGTARLEVKTGTANVLISFKFFLSNFY